MPASMARFDHQEITAWSRGLLDVSKVHWPLSAWVPIWFHRLPLVGKGLVRVNGLAHLLVLATLGAVLLLPWINRWRFRVAIMAVVCALSVVPLARHALRGGLGPLWMPRDYARYGCRAGAVGKVVVWFPRRGDRAGYHCFPSTPYRRRLDQIELRGQGLSDGFRTVERLRHRRLSTYGHLLDEPAARSPACGRGGYSVDSL